MQLNSLSSAPGHRHAKKRVGRGIGSGLGKTCGRGHKGQTSRSGGTIKPGFEGGQMPLRKRLGELNLVNADVVDLTALKAAGIVGSHVTRAKVFLSGELKKAVALKGIGVTKGAREAIEKAGGKIEA